LDLTRLIELMQAVPRDAYGIQSRFSVVDVARYRFEFNGRWLDSSGNGYTLQTMGPADSASIPSISGVWGNTPPEGSGNLMLKADYNRFGGYLRSTFPVGTFSNQLLVSLWTTPIFRATIAPYVDVLFSFETPLMDGYIYLYHFSKGLYLRARSSGHAECAASRPGPFFPVRRQTSTDLSLPSRFIEVTTQLDDTDATAAGATAGLSTISVSVDGQPILSVTGCMLDNALYTKLHVGAASGVVYGLYATKLKIDDLRVRIGVPIGQM
jgi:hypothetical protein